jgi:hypothetical protein
MRVGRNENIPSGHGPVREAAGHDLRTRLREPRDTTLRRMLGQFLVVLGRDPIEVDAAIAQRSEPELVDSVRELIYNLAPMIAIADETTQREVATLAQSLAHEVAVLAVADALAEPRGVATLDRGNTRWVMASPTIVADAVLMLIRRGHDPGAVGSGLRALLAVADDWTDDFLSVLEAPIEPLRQRALGRTVLDPDAGAGRSAQLAWLTMGRLVDAGCDAATVGQFLFGVGAGNSSWCSHPDTHHDDGAVPIVTAKATPDAQMGLAEARRDLKRLKRVQAFLKTVRGRHGMRRLRDRVLRDQNMIAWAHHRRTPLAGARRRPVTAHFGVSAARSPGSDGDDDGPTDPPLHQPRTHAPQFPAVSFAFPRSNRSLPAFSSGPRLRALPARERRAA